MPSSKTLLHKILSLIINDGHWYCFCKDAPGCRGEAGIKNWCLICILKDE